MFCMDFSRVRERGPPPLKPSWSSSWWKWGRRSSVNYSSTYVIHMTHWIGRGAWRLLLDTGLVRGCRGSYSTTGIISQWWLERGAIKASRSRSTEGSPRGFLYTPPSLIWWLMQWFVIRSRWWRGRNQDRTDFACGPMDDGFVLRRWRNYHLV